MVFSQNSRNRILKFAPEALWVFAEQAGIALAAFLGIKLLTLVLNTSEFGKLTLANTIISLIGVSFLGPLGQGIFRFWSISKENNSLNVFCYLFEKIKFYIHIIAFVLVLILFCIVLTVSNINLSVLTITSIIIGVLTGLFSLIISVFTADRQRQWSAILQVSNKFLRPLLATSLIVVIVPYANIALLGYLIAAIIIYIIAKMFYCRCIIKKYAVVFLKQQSSEDCKKLFREIWKYSLPFVIWSGFSWIHMNCDKWVLQLFCGSEVVGAFAVISSLSTFPLTFGSAFLTSLFTPVAFQRIESNRQKNPTAATNKILLLMVIVYTFGLLLLILFFLFFHRSLVILVSNKSFLTYSYFLPWLTLGWGFFYLGQILVLWGQVAKNTQIYIIPKCFTAIIALAFTLVLSSIYGVKGIIWGLCIAGFIYALWCTVIAVHFTKKLQVEKI